MRRVVLALVLLGTLTARAEAQEVAPTAAAPVDDPLSIYVLTFGPGDHPFFMFGHDALLVRDRAAGTDRVFNFGTFSFDSPRLIFDFLKGRLTYWLSVSSLSVTLASYEHENRSIVAQQLALAPEAKRALVARLEENARPENRAYKYDYFLDNCSTRVRDAVDRATDGALRASASEPARLTLRQQALRMTSRSAWFSLALDVVLAGAADRPIDRWAEMYIPEELEAGLRAVAVGGRPLVASEQTIFRASRPEPPHEPPSRFVSLLLVGLALGVLFVALGWAAPLSRAARAGFGLVVAAWGLVTGFIGSFLVYVWGFTDHVVAHRNENIFLCAPWAFALAVLGLGVTFGSRRATLAALRVSVSALLFALLGWGLKALPAFRHQDNAALIALLVPAWIGLSAGLLHARHSG
ncbi:MAG TPA: DUF4105 domain-containing protein [Polyangia bacterium]|nr:DUF4105 domain-containing protein [Polyangia bacterium]